MESKKKLSGSEYQKQARIKKLKHVALIKSCRKLDTMFLPSTNSKILNQPTEINMNLDNSNVSSFGQHDSIKIGENIETENTDEKLEMLNQDKQIKMNVDYSKVIICSSEQLDPTEISENIETENTDEKLEMLNQGKQLKSNVDYLNVCISEQLDPTKISLNDNRGFDPANK